MPPPTVVTIVSNDIYVAQRTESGTVDTVIPQWAENLKYSEMGALR